MNNAAGEVVPAQQYQPAVSEQVEIKKIYHIVKVLEQNPFLDTMKAVLGSDGEELNSFMTLILDFEETYVYSAIQE